MQMQTMSQQDEIFEASMYFQGLRQLRRRRQDEIFEASMYFQGLRQLRRRRGRLRRSLLLSLLNDDEKGDDIDSRNETIRKDALMLFRGKLEYFVFVCFQTN